MPLQPKNVKYRFCIVTLGLLDIKWQVHRAKASSGTATEEQGRKKVGAGEGWEGGTVFAELEIQVK